MNLELECPGCKALLELDAGFAGGVCRCFNCGTLMTVPADGEADHAAHALRRPERPDQPGQPAPVAPAVGTYVTDDGRTVQISPKKVVTARKRRSATRTVTTLIFAVVVLAIAGVGVGTFYMLVLRGEPTITAEQATRQTLGYDPTVNPFTLATPNVLGLSLPGDTAIVVDASQGSRTYLDAVNLALRRGLTQFGDDRVMLVYAGAGDPVALHASAQATRSITATAIADVQDDIRPRGVADLPAALGLAMQPGLRHLVLILAQHVRADDVEAALGALADPPQTIDIIHLSGDDDALGAVAEATGGRYVPLSPAQLADWYRAAP